MLLKLYDMEHRAVAGLKNHRDARVESALEGGDRTLYFLWHQRNRTEVPLEYYIRTDRDEYVVKENSKAAGGYRQVVARLNLEGLEGRAWREFTAEGATAGQMAEYALSGTGWTCTSAIPGGRLRSIRMRNTSAYGIIMRIVEAFFCEVEFDTIHKTVSLKEQVGGDRGAYFIRGLNLLELTDRADSYDYATRIIPIGADGLGIESVNGGVAYLENHQHSTKDKCVIWEDSSYTDPNDLKGDAERKLAEISKPKRTLQARTADLARMKPGYGMLAYSVGDTVTLVDSDAGIRERQRIVRTVEYLESPQKNTCDISNTALSFEEMQKRLFAAAECLGNITTGNGTVKGSSVDRIDVTQIIGMDRYITQDADEIQAGHIYVREELGAPVAVIGRGTFTSIASASLGIQGRADIKEAHVGELHADMQYAEHARFKTVESENIAALEARVDRITSSTVTTDYLEANYAQIDCANVDTAHIRQGFLQSLMVSQGMVADRVQAGEVIATNVLTGVRIDASDIAVGRLDAANIEVTNLNAASITVGTINGHQIAQGAISLDKLDDEFSGTISSVGRDVQQALADAGLAAGAASAAQSTADTAAAAASTAKKAADTAQSTANIASAAASTAKKAADTAQSTADAAKSTAENAQTEIVKAKTAIGSVEKEVQQALEDAGLAAEAAGAAQSMADTAATAANNAKKAADTAQGTADTASTAASNAKKAAATAQSTADTANAAAGNAQKAAATAQSTADTANAAAGNAQKAADTAQSTANTASTAASNAKKAADTAQGTAAAAKSTAENAQAEIGKVKTAIGSVEAEVQQALADAGLAAEAASAAQSAADTANTAAGNAQKAANTAQSTADAANTAAGNAQTAANNAQEMANAAKAAAGAAQSTANGKNTVFYQAAQPSISGRKANDVWFDTDDGNRMYFFDGKAWAQKQFGTNAIANAAITDALIANATITSAKISQLDAGKLTSGYISADRIRAGAVTAEKIAANAITAEKIISGAVTAIKIAADAVEADKIAANAVTADKIDTSAVTADKIDAGAVTADKMAANAVTAEKIISGAVTAIKIAADAVEADKIAANAVTAGKIDASAVTAEKLAAGAVTAGKIAASAVKAENIASNAIIAEKIISGAVTTAKLSTDAVTADKIAANAVTAGKISTGAVTAGKIAANAVTAEKIASSAVTADKIAARTITASKIVSGSITSTEINVSNLVSDGLIGANKLTAGNIDVSSLFAQTITASGSIQSSNYAYTSGNYSTKGIRLVMSTGQLISRKFAIDSSGNAYFAGDISGAKISGSSISAGTITGARISGGTVSGVAISGGEISSTGSIQAGGVVYEEKTHIKDGHITNSGYNGGRERMLSVANGILDVGLKDGSYKTSIRAEAFTVYKGSGGVFTINAEGNRMSTSLNASFSGTVEIDGPMLPSADKAKNMGSPSKMWNNIYAKSLVIKGSYSSEGSIGGVWKDGASHAALLMDSTGLNTCLGWAGSSTYKTAVILRGQSVRLGSATGTVVTSDERLKNSFQDLGRYEGFFYKLEPYAFKYNDGTSGRYHCGFKAQQVLAALEASGLTTQDFAGFVRFPVSSSSEEYHGFDEEYGVIYTEFIPLLVHEVQKGKAELAAYRQEAGKRMAELEAYKQEAGERMASMEEELGRLREALAELSGRKEAA